nr:UDP-glucose/GDP-mannose dehydrogenase family protein [Candidatus Baldrarchaeota archaeon]
MSTWKVSIFGLGYVGLSHAVAYALRGTKIVGFDVDRKKIELIRKGISPIKEPDVVKHLENLVKTGKIKVTEDHKDAVLSTNISFICVNTPPLQDGSADLSQVKSAISMIGEVLRNKEEFHLVVVNSTVPPTTTENVVKPLLEDVSGKKIGEDVGLCFMPEFLREGSAVQDILNPWRIVIGEVDKKGGDVLHQFLLDVYRGKLPPLIRTAPVNAELIKYASNAFLAMRVSFINTIARLCELLPKANVDVVAYGMGLDPRIGTRYLKAGPGFGGICLPKDLRALITVSEKLGFDPILFKAIYEVNEAQIRHVVEIVEMLLGDLSDRVVAILGLAFKAGIDDVRESPAIKIIDHLLERNTKVKVYDPLAMDNVKTVLKDRVSYASSMYECIKDSDVVIIVTDWDEFKKMEIKKLRSLMKKPTIIDTRRVLIGKAPKNSKEILYTAIGRPLSPKPPKKKNES